jgi:hypothetical protein
MIAGSYQILSEANVERRCRPVRVVAVIEAGSWYPAVTVILDNPLEILNVMDHGRLSTDSVLHCKVGHDRSLKFQVENLLSRSDIGDHSVARPRPCHFFQATGCRHSQDCFEEQQQ